MPTAPLPCQPHPGDLIKIIRKLTEAGQVSFSEHAMDRALERGIDLLDALRVLKSGMIKGSIGPGINAGEWKCKVADQADGSSRWIGVPVVVIGTRHILVLTVDWED